MNIKLVEHRSPKPLRRVSFKKLQKENDSYTCISLFTGAGGAALGIRQAGAEIRVMVEFDRHACATLRANWIDRPQNWLKQLAAEEKAYRRKRSWFAKTYETPLLARAPTSDHERRHHEDDHGGDPSGGRT
jgi:16S rRNA G966 N2-methylase RsmD